MAEKISVKKYTGVYYTESKVKRWRDRPDRCYWINFKDARNGKLRWERCGWASEGWTPEAAQRKRYELLEQDRAGDYKPKQDRKQETLTFGELMEQYYLPWADENKKRARDDRCIYRTWLSAPFSQKFMKDIAPLDLERLKKEMRDQGKADATVRHALCLIRQAFNKAAAWGIWHGENPCRAVKFPIPNNARQRFLTYQEAERLLSALRVHSGQLAQIATMSLYGGLRLSEIFELKWGNVDFENGIIHIMDTKNKENRPVFITDPLKSTLDELTQGEPDERLFKTKQGQPIVWLSKTFRQVVDEIGLNTGISDNRNKVTFHTLRHTYASWAVMAGIPLYVVGKAIGHKTVVMTQRYSHLAPDSHRAAFEAVASTKDLRQNTCVNVLDE